MLFYKKITIYILGWICLVQKVDVVHTSNLCDAFSNSIVSCYSSQVIPFKDKRETGNSLWIRVGVRSVIECAVICSQDFGCVSYFYHKDDRSCSGHSIVFTNAPSAVIYLGNRYFLFDRATAGNIEDSCTSSSECITENAECRENHCQCIPGYSFSPSGNTCSASCSTYGNTFTRFMGYYINGFNEDTFYGVSYETCAASCISAAGYTCRTFDYREDNGYCFLQAVTKLDYGWSNQASGYDHYHRNCM